MTSEQKQIIADILTEKPLLIRVGIFTFRCKPLTLGQIYEMGAVANEIDSSDLTDNIDKKMRIMSAVVDHYKDAKLMQKIFLICLFRSRWKRRLWGWYIRKKQTVLIFQQLINYIALSFNANFFLTSIIFLRQTTVMTDPSQTTAHGQQSEE